MAKLITIFTLLFTFAFAAESAWAHAVLLESVPGDAAELNESPPEVVLRFNEDVRLLRLEIKDADGNAVDSGFSAAAEASSSFAVSLPALADGAYSVEWTIISADGHRVAGEFGFRLDTAAVPCH